MGPIKSIFSAIRNIHRIKGRAPRREYWWVIALLIGGVILATLIDSVFFPEGVEHVGIYSFLNFVFILLYISTLILTLSVTLRRLHDLDMSGWYAFTYILPLGIGFFIMAIICSRKGTSGPNRFGPDPFYVDVFSDVEVFG